jgi:hypothetical protein
MKLLRKIPQALGFLLFWALLSGLPVLSQTECGVVDAISYPINPDTFVLAQDYAVPSQRHQGRYHTGEDWYAGRDMTAGQPVRAAARGRVTYSYGLGWGRDGGVVIIQHFLPDGTIFYTQYGHLQDNDAYPLPSRLSCVEQGAIIGSIASARPAPHLHFEVRVLDGSSPGPGYTRTTPYDAGYRDPNKVLRNLQAHLHISYRWHIAFSGDSPAHDRAPIAPPLLLADTSLLYLNSDGTILRRATGDGRVLWRARLETPAVAITGFQGAPLLTYADGTMQEVAVVSGALGDRWQVDARLTDAPIVRGTDLIFPADDDTLVAIGENRRDILWQADDVPPIVRAHVLDTGAIALMTTTDELILLDSTGQRLERTSLRATASFATGDDGALLALTRGGLWRVGYDGTWSLVQDVQSDRTRALLQGSDERLLIYDGTRLQALNRDGRLLWDSRLPALAGQIEMAQYGNIVILLSNQGQLYLVNDSGGFCNQVTFYGSPQARQWHDLGADGILRIAVADQILALDWNTLTRPCNV